MLEAPLYTYRGTLVKYSKESRHHYIYTTYKQTTKYSYSVILKTLIYLRLLILTVHKNHISEKIKVSLDALVKLYPSVFFAR